MHPDGSINWSYIFITLIIRFLGVALLLAIMGLGVALMGKICAKIAPNSDKTPDNKQ